MDIKYGDVVTDNKGKTLGKVDYIIMDAWSGEPSKFMVRREKEDDAAFFTPGQVAEVKKNKVKLNISAEEIEQT